MSSTATTELTSFRDFLDKRIADGESELTPEAALRVWRERQETVHAIRRGLADADAGRVRPADDLFEELRARLARR